MKLTQPRMHPKWRTPSRKPFEPQGITLGSEVIVNWLPNDIIFQVWAKAPRNGWWVAGPQGVVDVSEADLTLIRQCVEDIELDLDGIA
jgi:hypothetical protein